MIPIVGPLILYTHCITIQLIRLKFLIKTDPIFLYRNLFSILNLPSSLHLSFIFFVNKEKE